MDSVDSSCFRHVLLLWDARDSVAGKKPRQEIHRRDSHSDTEEHTGKHTLRAAFPEGEGKAGHDNRNEREAASDGAGESLRPNDSPALRGRRGRSLRADCVENLRGSHSNVLQAIRQ